MSEHSPLPWRRTSPNGLNRGVECGIKAADEWTIADTFADVEELTPEIARANAEFIVRAVNAHDDLLAAAKLTVLHFERTRVSGGFQGDDEHEAWSALTAAIAKAEATAHV